MYRVVQLLSLSDFRTVSSPRKETPYLLTKLALLLLPTPQRLVVPGHLSVSGFARSGTSWEGNHVICDHSCLVSLSQQHVSRFVRAVTLWSSRRCVGAPRSVVPWLVFPVWPWWIIPLWTFTYKFVWTYVFIYPEVDLLDHMVIL